MAQFGWREIGATRFPAGFEPATSGSGVIREHATVGDGRSAIDGEISHQAKRNCLTVETCDVVVGQKESFNCAVEDDHLEILFSFYRGNNLVELRNRCRTEDDERLAANRKFPRRSKFQT